MEVIVEGVGEQQDSAAGLGTRDSGLAPAKPGTKRFGGEGRERTIGRGSGEPTRDGGQAGSLSEEVGEAGRKGRQARPPGDQTEGVGGPRPQSPRVVVGEKLRLVGGHVHADRAVFLAALA